MPARTDAPVGTPRRTPILGGRGAGFLDLAPLALTIVLAIAATVASCAPKPTIDVMGNAAPGEPEMRVRVGKEQSEATLDAASAITVWTSRSVDRAANLKGPLRVRIGETGWVITDASGASRGFPRGEPLFVRPAGATSVRFNNAEYPGMFRLYARDDVSPGVFDIVEHLALEQYLPGVLAKELPAGWSPAAFEAQAIAARTYAMQERQRRLAAGAIFDVEATDRDQVYGGMTANPRLLAAVKSTKGKVVTFNGVLLRAYFSSTCGGRPASAKDIWPTTKGMEFNLMPPIQGKPREFACESSPLYRWKVERDSADLLKRIAAWGEQEQLAVRQMTSLVRIQPVELNEAQRPNKYRLYDAAGKHWTLTAEQLRNACNFSGGKFAAVTRQTRVHSGDFEVEIKGPVATFTGRGFGHGVGMCQYCAEGFARKGEDAATMLRRFYPGADITSQY